MKKFISLLLIAVLALSLVACGPAVEEDDPAKANQIVGTWTLGVFTHTFREDGTGVVMSSPSISMECTWEYAKGQYTIVYGTGKQVATITENEDGTLTLHYNEGEYKQVTE